MPWKETDPLTERQKFIMEWVSKGFTVPSSATDTASAFDAPNSSFPLTTECRRAADFASAIFCH